MRSYFASDHERAARQNGLLSTWIKCPPSLNRPYARHSTTTRGAPTEASVGTSNGSLYGVVDEVRRSTRVGSRRPADYQTGFQRSITAILCRSTKLTPHRRLPWRDSSMSGNLAADGNRVRLDCSGRRLTSSGMFSPNYVACLTPASPTFRHSSHLIRNGHIRAKNQRQKLARGDDMSLLMKCNSTSEAFGLRAPMPRRQATWSSPLLLDRGQSNYGHLVRCPQSAFWLMSPLPRGQSKTNAMDKPTVILNPAARLGEVQQRAGHPPAWTCARRCR
jgi:hypothetical protein